jgi:Excalibur calcium-binding domain
MDLCFNGGGEGAEFAGERSFRLDRNKDGIACESLR